jgi:hypothetical protein
MSMEAITGILTPPGDFESFLGGAYPAFIRLVGYIRVHYVMDEIWNGTNNLEFKKGGKSLIVLELKEGKFNALVIYGKAAMLSLDGAGKCGNRCDLCALYISNNENSKADNKLFHELDWKAYHIEGEKRADYTSITCKGCGGMCSGTIECIKNKGYDPGKCNLGLSADEVTRIIIPYVGKERYEWARK